VGERQQAGSVRERRNSALGIKADLEQARTHFKLRRASGNALDAS
jgi:hypothetical protein